MSETVANLLQKMEGITAALVTPLDSEGRLDVASLERLINRIINYGASCIFPLGWCGEQPVLPDDVRTATLRETVRIVNGRLPVMAGVSEQSLPRTLHWATIASYAGSAAIIATPPYSYPVPQEFVLEYFSELARLSSVPLVVYRNDDVSVRVEVETIKRLCDIPGIVGVKGYMPYGELQAAYYQANRPGRFVVISGDESLFAAALFLGIRHFTLGAPSNFCMKWCYSTYRSAVEDNWNAVREKQKRLMAFLSPLCKLPVSFMAVKKYIMNRLGICEVHVTAPARPIPLETCKIIDALMDQHRDVLDPCET